MAESEGVQRPCVLWLCAAVDVADPGVACATQASGTTIHIRPNCRTILWNPIAIGQGCVMNNGAL